MFKSALDKLCNIANNEIEGALSGWDSILLKYLTELVREGEITYEDIGNRKVESNLFCMEKDTI